MEKIQRNGKIIQRSKNLAGIRRYVATNLIRAMAVTREPDGGGAMSIAFDNGAVFVTKFADYSVLCGWVRRWKNAWGAPLRVSGCDCGKLSKDTEELIEGERELYETK